MSQHLVDMRMPLAASAHTRVELGRDGVLHVLAGPVTLHLDRVVCEELTTTLARAMVTLARARPTSPHPALAIIPGGATGAPQPGLEPTTGGSSC